MTGKRLAAVVGVVALVAVVGVLVVGTAFAQSDTPGSQATPAFPKAGALGVGRGPGMMGFMGGGWVADFDAMAKALNLTPTQLFEQLHSGKTLAEIATAQKVDLTKVQEAANATRIQAMKDRIAQSVKDGTMTQDQADWLLKGLEKGYMGKGMGGFDGGRMGRGGMRGFGGQAPSKTPGRTSPGTTS